VSDTIVKLKKIDDIIFFFMNNINYEGSDIRKTRIATHTIIIVFVVSIILFPRVKVIMGEIDFSTYTSCDL